MEKKFRERMKKINEEIAHLEEQLKVQSKLELKEEKLLEFLNNLIANFPGFLSENEKKKLWTFYYEHNVKLLPYICEAIYFALIGNKWPKYTKLRDALYLTTIRIYLEFVPSGVLGLMKDVNKIGWDEGLKKFELYLLTWVEILLNKDYAKFFGVRPLSLKAIRQWKWKEFPKGVLLPFIIYGLKFAFNSHLKKAYRNSNTRKKDIEEFIDKHLPTLSEVVEKAFPYFSIYNIKNEKKIVYPKFNYRNFSICLLAEKFKVSPGTLENELSEFKLKARKLKNVYPNKEDLDTFKKNFRDYLSSYLKNFLLTS